MDKCIEHNQKGIGLGYASTSRKGITVWKHRLVYCDANDLTLEDIKGKVVRHKCDNPRCINPQHLEIGTHNDNMKDMTKHNRQAKGVDQGASKLTDADVLYIREHYIPNSKDVSQRVLARKFGVAQSTVRTVLNKDSWKHI